MYASSIAASLYNLWYAKRVDLARKSGNFGKEIGGVDEKALINSCSTA